MICRASSGLGKSSTRTVKYKTFFGVCGLFSPSQRWTISRSIVSMPFPAATPAR
jgi:hypothetical protein